MQGQYEIMQRSLIQMKEEYKIMPSKFLLKCIELTEKKIKQADKALGMKTTPNGNYTKATDNA